MKQLILLLALVFGVAVTARAQVQEKTPATTTEAAAPVMDEADTDGAEMTFEQMEVDYGTIQQDSDPYRVFTFTNTGSEALLITNARGSCGCTVPSYSKAPIAPGETSEIKVRYDTHRLGQFRKRVTLTTNASEEPIVLTIKGLVEAKPEQPEAVPATEEGLFNNGGN